MERVEGNVVFVVVVCFVRACLYVFCWFCFRFLTFIYIFFHLWFFDSVRVCHACVCAWSCFCFHELDNVHLVEFMYFAFTHNARDSYFSQLRVSLSSCDVFECWLTPFLFSLSFCLFVCLIKIKCMSISTKASHLPDNQSFSSVSLDWRRAVNLSVGYELHDQLMGHRYRLVPYLLSCIYLCVFAALCLLVYVYGMAVFLSAARLNLPTFVSCIFVQWQHEACEC